jgi:hypothetical protein
MLNERMVSSSCGMLEGLRPEWIVLGVPRRSFGMKGPKRGEANKDSLVTFCTPFVIFSRKGGLRRSNGVLLEVLHQWDDGNKIAESSP